MDAPEIHAPHKSHGAGLRWFEIVTSLTALLVSAVSIKVALHHGEVMEKLVTANSIPYVVTEKNNAVLNPAGGYDPVLELALKNSGVGPAEVHSVTLKWQGRYLRDLTDIYKAAGLADEKPLPVRLNTSQKHFIAAGDKVTLVSIPKPDDRSATWARLERVIQQSQLEACYCSVFQECWLTASDHVEAVDQCEIATDKRFIPFAFSNTAPLN